MSEKVKFRELGVEEEGQVSEDEWRRTRSEEEEEEEESARGLARAGAGGEGGGSVFFTHLTVVSC